MKTRLLTFVTALALGGLCAWGLTAIGGDSEGIQVHGHWTLDIHDPDGALIASHEFDNALTDTGDSAFPWLLFWADTINGRTGLTDQSVFAQPVWAVLAGQPDGVDFTGTSPCTDSLTDIEPIYNPNPLFDSGCTLLDAHVASDPADDGILFKGLPAGATPFPSSPSEQTVSRLKGSFTATQTGVISQVETYVALAMTDPGDFASVRFSSASVGPFDVETNQVVTITVDFTFS